MKNQPADMTILKQLLLTLSIMSVSAQSSRLWFRYDSKTQESYALIVVSMTSYVAFVNSPRTTMQQPNYHVYDFQHQTALRHEFEQRVRSHTPLDLARLRAAFQDTLPVGAIWRQNTAQNEPTYLLRLDAVGYAVQIELDSDEDTDIRQIFHSPQDLAEQNVALQLRPTRSGAFAVYDGAQRVSPIFDAVLIESLDYIFARLNSDEVGYYDKRRRCFTRLSISAFEQAVAYQRELLRLDSDFQQIVGIKSTSRKHSIRLAPSR